MKRLAFLFALFVPATALLWACGNPTSSNPAKITISLSADKFKAGDTITATISVENFTLSKAAMDGANKAGEGHYHIYLDGETSKAILIDAEPTAKIQLPSDITAGKHTLRAELRQNDHTALDPKVETTVEFEVTTDTNTDPDPVLTVTLANSGPIQAGDAAKLTIKVENFALTPITANAQNKKGEGHYHIYLDDNTGKDYLSADHAESADVTIPLDTKAGKHSLRVVLQNNDHTPYLDKDQKPIEKVVEFEVAAVNGPAFTATPDKTDVNPGDKITLTVNVTNFTLSADNMGSPSKEGEGHYHVYLDDKTGNDYLYAGAETTSEINIPSDTPTGKHTLRVSLRNNDHSELSPKVEKTIEINVKDVNKPTVSMTADKSDVKTDEEITLTIKAENFILDPANVGKANNPGYGHYHIYLDDKTGNDYLYAGASLTAKVKIPAGTSAGDHKLTISLRNNDHSELNPKVEATVNIKVAQGDPSVTGILSPTRIFPGGNIQLTLNVANFKLDPAAIGKANAAGTGHVHVYLDDKTGNDYLYAGADSKFNVTIPKGTNPGTHVLRVSLRNNDHSELSPKAEVKLDFSITEETAPKVEGKLDKSSVEAGSDVELTVTTQNFILDAASIGKANKLGTGHYHVYLDNGNGLNYIYAGADAKAKITIPSNTVSGKHSLRISLRNNDHSAFTPKTEAILEIDVTASTKPTVSATADTDHVAQGGKLKLALKTTNFQLDAANIGKANANGKGHVHVYLDNNVGTNYLYAGADANPEITIPASTGVGIHTLRVSLRNNDHTEHASKADATVRITVTDGNPKVFATPDKATVNAGDKIKLDVMAWHFKIDAASIGKANAAGVGHYHVYLDSKTGGEYLYAGADATADIVIPASTSAGAHTLRVSLRNNDHSELNPKAETVVNFTVGGSTGNQPTVDATPDKTTVKAGEKVKLTVTAQNFQIDPTSIGKANASGVGHYHVYLDNNTGGNYIYAGGDATAEVTIPANTAAGAHTLVISLRNNDHSELSPKVEKTINITVTTGGSTGPTCGASYANCTTFVDRTASGASREITFGGSAGLTYSPKCIMIKVGQTITFKGGFQGHPLKAEACETTNTIKDTNSGTSVTFTFTQAGYYNYYCEFHKGNGMVGNIHVVP